MATKWWNLPANNTELFDMAKSALDWVKDWIKNVDTKATLDDTTEKMVELARYDDWHKSMDKNYKTPHIIEELWGDYEKRLESVGGNMDDVRKKYYKRYPTKEMEARDNAWVVLNNRFYNILWKAPSWGGNAWIYLNTPVTWNYYWFSLDWAKLDNLDINSKIRQATDSGDKATVNVLNSIKNGKTPYSSWNVQSHTLYWFVAPEDAPNKNWVQSPIKLIAWDPYVWRMDENYIYVVNLKTKQSNRYPREINVWDTTDVDNVNRFKNIISTFTNNYYKWDTAVPVLDSLYDEEDYARYQWVPYESNTSTFSRWTRVPSSRWLRKLY